MALKKKKSSAKKKQAIDFGAALAKARQETDHIFKQASADENSNNSSNSAKNNDDSDDKVSPRSKAAAWAWYQRGGGNDGNASPEDVRNRALVVVQRASRFKAEALRVNGSYTAGDTIVKVQQKWDPTQSLFDSFELLSVAKELDKALKEASAASVASRSLVSLDCSSAKSGRSKSGGGGGCKKQREALATRLIRFIPTPVLCLSEDDIATKRTLKKSRSASSSVSSNSSSNIISSSSTSSSSLNNTGGGSGNWISAKFSQLLSFNSAPPVMELIDRDGARIDDEQDRDTDDELYLYRHDHFHHHLHHHHHHVGRSSRLNR